MRPLRWVVITIAVLLAIILAAAAFVVTSEVTVSLDDYRERIETLATSALGREVRITGPIALKPSLRPTLQVEGLRIANPPQWQAGELLRCELARLRLDIIGLLGGRLRIEEFAGQGLSIHLERSASGATSWQLDSASEQTFDATTTRQPDDGDHIQFDGVEKLTLEDVIVIYTAAELPAAHEFRFEGIAGSIPANRPLDLAIKGEFRRQAYTIQLTGGAIEDLLISGRSWPLELAAVAAGAQLRIQGTIAEPGPTAGTALELELFGDRLGELASWLPVSPSTRASYGLTGRVQSTSDELRLSLTHAQLGRTRFSGALGFTNVSVDPLFFAQLDFNLLDPNELEAIFAPLQEQSAEDKPMKLEDFPIEVLARGERFEDADVNITAERILLDPTPVTQVVWTARFRDEISEEASMQVAIGKTVFRGESSLDFSGEIPRAALSLTSEQVDVGELLSLLNISKGISATTGRLGLTVTGSGSTLGQFFRQSDIAINLEDGQWTLDDPNLPGKTPLRVDTGTLTASLGSPLKLSLAGAIAKTPVKISLEGGSIAEVINPRDRLKLRLRVEAAGSRLDLTGAVALPIERTKLALEMALRGKRLDHLEPLLGTQLPPLGPYALTAALNVVKDGYYLSNMDLLVGQSHLYGGGAFQITDGRHQVSIKLSASTLQMNDFFQGSLVGLLVDVDPDEKSSGTTADSNVYRDWAELLDPAFLDSFDTGLEFKITRLLSGKDTVTNVHIAATLMNGQLHISPLEAKLPSGSFTARLTLEPTRTEVKTNLWLQAERYDYGMTTRRFDPKTEMDGLITLNANISSRDPDLSTMFNDATGTIDFAIWPREFEAGVMDTWALNIFTALMTEVREEAGSTINCIVGRFTGQNGILKPSLLVIDTTRVRAAGSGQIDLRNDGINLVLVPRIKRAKLLSLDTPVVVQGTFSDYDIELTSADALKASARLAFELFYIPVALILKSGIKVLPADGHDLCDNPMAWSGDPTR